MPRKPNIEVTLSAACLGEHADEEFFASWRDFVKDALESDFPDAAISVYTRRFGDGGDDIINTNLTTEEDETILDALVHSYWDDFCAAGADAAK